MSVPWHSILFHLVQNNFTHHPCPINIHLVHFDILNYLSLHCHPELSKCAKCPPGIEPPFCTVYGSDGNAKVLSPQTFSFTKSFKVDLDLSYIWLSHCDQFLIYRCGLFKFYPSFNIFSYYFPCLKNVSYTWIEFISWNWSG